MKWLTNLPLILVRKPLWFFVIWALWLSVEYWALGDFSYLFIHDNADQIIPVSTWLTESPERLLTAQLLPEMCGVDRFATTAWVNLHRLFCLAMPVWLAHGLFIFLQRFIAGYFTCRLLKEAFSVPPAVSMLAGAAYTLIGLEHGEMRLMHNLNEPGFPLMIWLLFSLPLKRFGMGFLAAVLGGLFFSLTMGPVGAWPFFFPASVLAALILRKDFDRPAACWKFVCLVFVFALCCLSLRIPSLMAMVPNGALSHRADWSAYPTFWLQWKHLMGTRPGMLIPWWGVLALSLCWVFQWRNRGRKDVAAITLLVIGLLLGPLMQSASVALKEHIGFLTGFNFTRFDRTLPLALMVVGALGLARFDNVVLNQDWLQMRLSSLVALLLFGMTAQHALMQKQDHLTAIQNEGKSWRTLYDNAEIKALAEDIAGSPVRCVTAGAYHEYHPLYALPSGLEIADGYVVMYPNYYQNYWAEVVRPLTDQEPEYFEGHFGWWGSRVYLFHSTRPENENIPEIPFAEWYNLDLLSLANVRYILSRKPIADERLQLRPQVVTQELRDQWWNLPAKEKAVGYLRGENPGAPMYIYENTNAVDRFFVTGEARWLESEEALYAYVAQAGISNLTRSVCLLRDDQYAPANLDAQPGATDAEIELVNIEQPEVHVVRVQGTKPSWLVFSSLYYPWWTCTVDGDTVPVLRAYGAFMAVRIPAGDHRVRFRYEPPYSVFK